MPEAPEVQTVLDTLACQIKGATIQDVGIRYPRMIEYPDAKSFSTKITQQSFHDFVRIGKYLLLILDQDILVCHLRMEGKFYIYSQVEESKHIHVIFTLADGRKLCYHDTRKFGRMALYPKTNDYSTLPMLAHVGFDFLDPQVNGLWFYHKIHTLKRNLKSVLLDQSIIAGVGNIYANEICFACRLDPRSRCTKLSKKDCEAIISQMRKIMLEAMQYGGTTIRDYTSSLGVTGRFQLHLKVHGKQGQPCPVCSRPIDKIVVAQRGTYLCRNCQKRK